MRLLDRGFGLVFFGLALLLTGCSGARLLMPTPNVHLDAERDFYSDLSRELKSTEVPLFYTTDRAPERVEQGNLRYGYERSPSLGFGTPPWWTSAWILPGKNSSRRAAPSIGSSG